MPTNITVILRDRPGELAVLGEAMGKAGVNMLGMSALTGEGRGVINVLVEDAEVARSALDAADLGIADEQEALVVDVRDTPGSLGGLARDLAEAGVNIDVAYTIFTGVRLVILTEDVDKAHTALDLNGASG